MENFTKEKIYSIIATGGFHLIVLLLLLFIYMEPFKPEPNRQVQLGVPVKFGNVADAFGTADPGGRGDGTSNAVNIDASVPDKAVDPTPARDVKPVNASAPNRSNVHTQTHTQTVSANTDALSKAEAVRRMEALAAENKRKEEEARIARAQAESAKINQNVGGLFGNGTGTSGSSGNSHGSGNQGTPTGNSNTGALTGIGGVGNVHLPNRNAVGAGLISPDYPVGVNAQGNVVVDIRVNPRGKVISARAGGKGTTTTNSQLWRAAERAALATSFNGITSPSDQSGTITYTFKLK